jgi:ATP-dependent Clp protease ATP-binding subunit ClpC
MPLNKLTQRARTILKKLSNSEHVTISEVVNLIDESTGLGSLVLKNLSISKKQLNKELELTALLKESYYQAAKLDHPYVGTEHIILAMLKLIGDPGYEIARDYLASVNIFPKAVKMLSANKENSILETYGKNLNREFVSLYKEPLVFRDELNTLVSVLLKKDNPNALIIGDPGVGKNSLVQLLVHSILSLDVPPVLGGYQIVEFDLMGYISSILNKGSLDASLNNLQNELKTSKRIILSIKNFQNLFVSTASGVGVPLLFPIFKEILESSGISFIAVMNNSIYEKINIENDHILENFTVIEVKEPEEENVMSILKLKAKVLGEFHNITISDQVIEFVYKIAKENIETLSFPQKGVDLLDVACSNLLVKKSKVPAEYKTLVDESISLFENLDKTMSKGKYDEAEKIEDKIKDLELHLNSHEDKMIYSKPLKLTQKDVEAALSDLEYAKESVSLISSKDLSRLADVIKKEVIGQDEAVNALVRALIRSKMGLRPKKRPVGTFLFLGPTGVGKTELAKILAKSSHLIRLDMSDFSEKHMVARLIGAPPGYIGFSEGGELTSKIEAHPESVVLFDEIEKAHPDVLNILLQIMEEGELVDAKGTSFDFSRATIILTSNLGTEILHNKEIGFADGLSDATEAKISGHLKNNLKKILKPELLNRFDEIIVFRRLTQQDQMKIVNVMLKEVDVTLKNQDVSIKIDQRVKKHLLEKGYSKEYGARALRRTIEQDLLDKIAEVLLVEKRRPLSLVATIKKSNVKIEKQKL